ncbi:MAG TPA: carboxypeptidase regulatory-like domain-containing protein [Candidatus Dormibacteraeota bacterium]|nr:carboxypeptidase regulatory-like domain-containing protein [Candidatus Dormibacteraeota bacterium]
MKGLRSLFPAILAVAALVVLPGQGHAQAKAQPTAVLQGTVTSAEEGPMEGVLVTVKKDGSNISITVSTNAQGRYRFPESRLQPGHYSLKIRAAGYDLDSPSAVDIPAGKSAVANLKLRKTANLAAQLTNAEWLESMPGTYEQKAALRNCTTCHTLLRPLGSTHDADEFVAVQTRMANYTNQSIPLMPQVHLAARYADQIEEHGEESLDRRKDAVKKLAEFLASVNLSKGPTWSYPLKTFPRPKGIATRALITEYDLPARTRQPHDVYVDSDGMVWYISFGEQVLGRLDPKTGKTTEFAIPTLKPKSPKGELALRPDPQGNLWIGMMYQGAVAKFDRKTEKFKTYSLPPGLNRDYTQITEVNPIRSNVDGKVWIVDAGTYTIYRLDPAPGKFESFKPFPDPSPNIYDITPDAQNNAYFTVFGADQIGRIDAKTGKITLYKTPTKDSNPRRGEVDSHGLFWFGEFRGNRIGMFNTKDLTFKEWTPPTPWSFPYDMVADRNGDVWGGSTMTDRMMRLDPRTGQIVEYLMPRNTNIRKVFVDNSTNPVTVWVGSNHGASIIKIEAPE